MLGQCHEMLAHQRISPRWKEWIPLVSQQLRLRNLIQILAYNVNTTDKVKCDLKNRGANSEKVKSSFYYTLHLTTMSAPFYTSEKLETENPKWAELEIGDFVNAINASVNGIVVRLWVHRNAEQDQVLTVWGVYFSGLVYLGPKLCSDPATFCLNTIVFHMHGGYFTAPQCFKNPVPHLSRHSQVKISAADVCPSYNVNLVSRLHTIQQAIKKQRYAAQILREKISVGGYTTPESRESATLRRLLNKSRPQAPQRQEVLKLQREIEMTKFRVEMLAQERIRKIAALQNFEKTKIVLYEVSQDRGKELMGKYQTLQKEIELLKEKKKSNADTKQIYQTIDKQLKYRQNQLITKLNQIYPIVQLPDGKFTICGVHLPNSEDFTGNDEVMISVSLGYVAHALQMLSIFMQVPLRYPIIHFGSWSKIVDHIAEKIPEKDREFPLFSRGKDKLQFNYGVYLLNKNVSQLRWDCGLQTFDLRATLPNLSNIMYLHSTDVPEYHHHHRISSGSSLDLRSSSQNQSPVGSAPMEFRKQPCEKKVMESFAKGHRVSRSMDGSSINFQANPIDPDVYSAKDLKIAKNQSELVNGSPSVTTSLSYSLDKGLDEYEELKKAELPAKPPLSLKPLTLGGRALASVGSEPILTQEMRDRIQKKDDPEIVSSEDEAKKHFLQNWQAGGPAPMCLDDEALSHIQASRDPFTVNTAEIQEGKTGISCALECGNANNSCSDDMQRLQCLEIPQLLQGCDRSECDNTLPCPSKLPYNHLNAPTIKETIEANNQITNEEGSPEDTMETIQNKNSVATYSHCDCDTNRELEYSEENKHFSETLFPTARSLQNGITQMINDEIQSQKVVFDEANSLQEMSNLIDSSVLVDSVFASVASRTEALASRSGTFNLVRSRHSSMLEDGNS